MYGVFSSRFSMIDYFMEILSLKLNKSYINIDYRNYTWKLQIFDNVFKEITRYLNYRNFPLLKYYV